MLGERIVEQARTYLGTPWRHLGRGGGGVDCVGLITCVAYDLDIVDYNTTYTRNTKQAEMVAQFRKFCDPVRLEDIRPGDIPLFAIAGRGHCGFFTGATLIHAFYPEGRVVEHPWSRWVKSRESKLTSIFRLRG